ncbi:hypothetical protein PV08_04086 [Exophiala spinifera]|uniref:BZIP domain-containing protein n=1 Tax=Exophiala spinifera TaxID=91928 RepID=A0A0D1YP19_9EURO|nr:uncharacterized protein PV08_04086 [Exophiala spinifera]KIW16896.1 hypothetical protein PV08_04086 [Exophiala spinifera]
MACDDGTPAPECDSRHGTGSRRGDSNLSRRERKRASDRMSQQATRARTKAYIAHLESTTQRLTEALAGEGTAALSKRLSEQHDQIETLKKALARIAMVANAANNGCNANDSESFLRAEVESRSLRDTILSNRCETILPSTEASVVDSKCGCFPSDTLAPANAFAQQESLLQMYSLPDLLCGNQDRDYFSILNQALETIENNHARHLFSGPEVDDDTCIRAILHGWDAARSRNPFDVGWQLLELLDEGLFCRSGSVERMAILRVMRAMLMTKINPRLTPERRPPAYMNPRLAYRRPSQFLLLMKYSHLQLQVSHVRLIDYFTWPEVRDYLIISGITYAPESLAAQFAADIGLKWPYTLRDTCTYRPSTGRYTFSHEFTAVCDDLESWYMKSPSIPSHLPISPDKFTTGSEEDWCEPLCEQWNMPLKDFPETSLFS